MKQIIFLLLLLFSLVSQAQNRKNRIVRRLQSEANLLLSQEEYKRAIPFYLKLDSLDNKNPDNFYYTGYCYLKSENRVKEAVKYLKIASQMKNVNPDVFYFLGLSQHLNNELEDAEASYRAYLNKTVNLYDEALIKNAIEQCQHARVLIAAPLPFEITNAPDPINTYYDDFAPLWTADQKHLLVTSRRPSVYASRDRTYEKLFLFEKSKNGNYVKTEMGNPFKNQSHINATQFTANGRKLFITKSDELSSGDIYISRIGDDYSISKPVKVTKSVNSRFPEAFASMTTDSSLIFFSSERPDGIGGKDIYCSRRIDRRTWASAQLLSSAINTPFDETCPVISPDGRTLYFSSQGHFSMGGFDIFKVQLEDGNWSLPANLGYPINTTADDEFFTPMKDGHAAYWSSNRPGGQGGWDIYSVNYESNILKVEQVVLLKAEIINAANSKPMNASISITTLDTSAISMHVLHDSTQSEAAIMLPVAKKYYLQVKAPGYLDYREELVNPTPQKDYTEIKRRIGMGTELSALVTTVTDSSNINHLELPGDTAVRILPKEQYRLTFRIELFPVNNTLKKSMGTLKNLSYETEGNTKRYFFGDFVTYSQALEKQIKLRALGFTETKIAAFVNGKSQPMDVK